MKPVVNDHHRQLLIAELLSNADSSAAEIAQAFDVSIQTVKRDIAMLRHLGAEIYSQRRFGATGWVYHLVNWKVIARTVTVWEALEATRDLTIMSEDEEAA